MNKKILLSFLLVILIALSAGVVSAESVDGDILADDAATSEVVADPVDEKVGAVEEPALTTTRTVSGDDADAVISAIDESSAGDIIDLGNGKTYTFNKTVTVNKNLTFIGNGVTINCAADENPANGYINVIKAGSGTKIQGITLINKNALVKYTGEDTLQGWGIYIRQATNCVVDNCTFWDWNHAVRIQQQANYNIVENCFFYGGTATFINNLPNGAKDRGTYDVGIMGSTGNIVRNNLFDGPVCDGVSIASGSGGNNVIGNTFKDNAYAIYFGGDSTKNTLLAHNTFIDCGAFESDVYNATNPDQVIGHVAFFDLPVISVQKSADNFQIVNNTFYAFTGNILIAAQEANTAHGAPSDIGNFTIKENTILPTDDGVVMHTIVLCSIESNMGTLNPTGNLLIVNNTLNGAKSATYWSADWGDNSGDVIVPAAKPLLTLITVDSMGSKKITGTLKDVNGKVLTGEVINYVFGSVNGTVETDENGVFTIEDIAGSGDVLFAGDNKLASSNVTCTLPSQKATQIIAEAVVTRTAVDYNAGERGTKYYFYLKDKDGNALANKGIKIGVVGKIYTAKTDANGRAGIDISIANANSYTYALTFLGDDEYAAAFAVSELKIVKKPVTITPAKTSYSFKTSAKTKTITATLKSSNSYIPKGKQVTLTIAGKTFKATVGDKGQINFNIGAITAKGTYKINIKYAGSNTYNAATSSTITVKIA